MADVFEEEVEQTVSIQEYLKDVEDQELVSLCVYWNFRVSCECVFSHPPTIFLVWWSRNCGKERKVWNTATLSSIHDFLEDFPLFSIIYREPNGLLCTVRLSNNWIICPEFRVLLYLFFYGVLHEWIF